MQRAYAPVSSDTLIINLPIISHTGSKLIRDILVFRTPPPVAISQISRTREDRVEL